MIDTEGTTGCEAVPIIQLETDPVFAKLFNTAFLWFDDKSYTFDREELLPEGRPSLNP